MSIKNKVYILLIMSMFAFVSMNLYISSLVNAGQQVTSIINILGKQRMLSQRISNETLEWYKYEMDESIESLKLSVTDFNKVIKVVSL